MTQRTNKTSEEHINEGKKKRQLGEELLSAGHVKTIQELYQIADYFVEAVQCFYDAVKKNPTQENLRIFDIANNAANNFLIHATKLAKLQEKNFNRNGYDTRLTSLMNLKNSIPKPTPTIKAPDLPPRKKPDLDTKPALPARQTPPLKKPQAPSTQAKVRKEMSPAPIGRSNAKVVIPIAPDPFDELLQSLPGERQNSLLNRIEKLTENLSFWKKQGHGKLPDGIVAIRNTLKKWHNQELTNTAALKSLYELGEMKIQNQSYGRKPATQKLYEALSELNSSKISELLNQESKWSPTTAKQDKQHAERMKQEFEKDPEVDPPPRFKK